MANNNSTVRKGQCINFGNCNKANTREIIEINIGDEFICPECDGSLVEIPNKSFPPKWLKIFLIALAILAVLGGIGFGGYKLYKSITKEKPQETKVEIDEPIEVPITPNDITIDETSCLFEKAGESKQLTATVFPDSVPEKNKKVIWQSSDESIAKVDESGRVTAVATGNAVISAYLGNGISATCYVQVDIKDGGGSGQRKVSVPGGSYSGELKNGQPHGMGTITYNTRTLIDSRDPKKRYAEAGQYLVGQFREGRLLQGKLCESNGNQIETIIIGGGAH